MFTKNSFWHTKWAIPSTVVTFHGDGSEIREDFAPNFGDKCSGFCITIMHLLTLPCSLGTILRWTTCFMFPTDPTRLTSLPDGR
jgi:hypothetical protein